MAFLNMVVRRLAAQRLLAAGLLVTMAFCIGVVVAGPIYADGSGRAIVGGTIDRALVTQRNVRYSLQIPPRFELASADRIVHDAVQALPTDRVVRQAATGAVGSVGPSGERLSTQVAYRVGAFSHLRIEGSPPRGPDEVVLASGDAFRLGVSQGGFVEVRSSNGTATVRVTGLYQVPPSDDPFWFGAGSLLYRQPAQDVAPGNIVTPTVDLLPLLSTEQGFARITGALGFESGPTIAWDVYLNLTGVDLDQLRAVANRVDTVAQRVSDASPTLAYLTTGTAIRLLATR
ncbi:MAG TPA: hypothetical protein VKA30_04735, partial [Actinomycetota bacterium]|nr:hypothetical protein [Actinomycetota bacterium]